MSSQDISGKEVKIRGLLCGCWILSESIKVVPERFFQLNRPRNNMVQH